MKAFRLQFILLALFVGALVFFLPMEEVFAAEVPQYTQLENIPGSVGKNKSFPEYVTTIYNLGLWIIGISAMFMLTVGGFMYLTSAGNTSAAGSAKGVIKDALIGLVLGLAAWLIVNTINPDLTTFNVSGLQTGTSTPPPPGGTPPVSAEGQYTHDEAVAALQDAGISVKSTGECSDQNKKECTSLKDIPKDAINKLVALHSGCSNCFTSVSGGTEVGHASHGSGLPRLDVIPEDALGVFLDTHKDQWGSYGINQICSTSKWQKISYQCKGYVEVKSHIHLGF